MLNMISGMTGGIEGMVPMLKPMLKSFGGDMGKMLVENFNPLDMISPQQLFISAIESALSMMSRYRAPTVSRISACLALISWRLDFSISRIAATVCRSNSRVTRAL